MTDINHDGTVDFNEFLVVIVLFNRLNDPGSRLAFVFDLLVCFLICVVHNLSKIGKASNECKTVANCLNSKYFLLTTI